MDNNFPEDLMQEAKKFRDLCVSRGVNVAVFMSVGLRENAHICGFKPDALKSTLYAAGCKDEKVKVEIQAGADALNYRDKERKIRKQ